MSRRARAVLPQPVRRKLYQYLPWRPWRSDVPIDKLLLGLQNRTPAGEFADFIGDLMWPSTRVVDGPHAALLRDAVQSKLSDEAILSSAYAELGRQCIALRGCFFWATDDAGIVEVAHDFIARHHGTASWSPRVHQSQAGSRVQVAPVRGSDCFQVIDGHHRVASAAMHGETVVPAKVKWLPVTTPLQETLDKMSWLQGGRELYQPIDAPELRRSWVTVRACTDRMHKMLTFLRERGLQPDGELAYLDVASCYGWFVANMTAAGYAGHGVERDPLAVPLGQAVYGLSPGQITTGDAVDMLRDGGQWDIVSCFSLLHHFVLGRGSVSAEELTQLLSKATGRVLFLETGQEHEEWFQQSLRGWDSDSVRAFLLEQTTFDEVIDLGPDNDAVPPYEKNYGRHLFACVRDA